MRSVLENVLEQCAKDIRIGIFREHLQKAILRSMHRAWGSPSLSFLGGACLRIAHGIGRFSEDLDFSQNDNEFDVNKLLHKVEKLLSKEGYICQIKHRNSKTAVKKAEIQFPGLLHEVGLSPHKSQTLNWHQIVEKKVHTFDDDVVTNDLQAFVIPSDHQRSITKQSISAAIRKAMVNRS